MLDLAGNDYLGLARHPSVIAAGVDALRVWGAGATASRLVTGTTTLHEEFETSLAEFVGSAAALVFSSGYLANLAAITALSDTDTLIVSDAWNHASLVDACRLARARVVVTPHNDLHAVATALARRRESHALVVTESVFSADGDAVELSAWRETARAGGAVLLIDDAHGLGVVGDRGQGGASAAGLAGDPDVVITVTLSKALGSQGGAVLGSTSVREHLVQTARSFIFDTGLAPVSVATAAEALRLLQSAPSLVTSMRSTALTLAGIVRAAGWDAPEPAGAVVPIMIGSAPRAVAAAGCCLDHGVRVGCFRPPSVPAGTSRLRLTARPHLSAAEVTRVADALAAVRRLP